jgi:hypothetical protein
MIFLRRRCSSHYHTYSSKLPVGFSRTLCLPFVQGKVEGEGQRDRPKGKGADGWRGPSWRPWARSQTAYRKQRVGPRSSGLHAEWQRETRQKAPVTVSDLGQSLFQGSQACSPRCKRGAVTTVAQGWLNLREKESVGSLWPPILCHAIIAPGVLVLLMTGRPPFWHLKLIYRTPWQAAH